MAIMASQNWAGQYMLDPTSRIHFSSFFPKKAWIILCKTDPDPIWMAYLGFDEMHLVWKQTGVLKSSGPVSGRMQPASYQFDTFRLGSVLPQTSQIILSKTSPNPICVRFWPNRSGLGNKPVCKNQSGMLLANASQPIWTGCESDPECLLLSLIHISEPTRRA